MKQWKFSRLAATAVLGLAASMAGAAGEWPARQITFVVPFAPGGNIDGVARIVARELAENFKQPVLVENRAGAGGMVGAAYVARSKPDGYTFLVGSNGIITNTLMRSDQPFKDEELVPVAFMSIAPSVLVVNPSSSAKNLREFVADAKKKSTDKMIFATAGVGSTPHFVSGLFKVASGINVEPVAYKSGQESVAAVVGGQVEIASEATPVVLPLIKAGRVKPLAVTLSHRSALLPDVPTTRELGFDSLEIGHFVGMVAPAATPADVVEQMSAAVRKALQSPEVQKALLSSGTEPMPRSRAEFTDYMKSERERLKVVVQAAGMSDQ